MAIPEPENGENSDTRDSKSRVDPFSNGAKAARMEHLLGFIQRNAELEARVKLLEELEREQKHMLQHEREIRTRTDSQLQKKQEVWCALPLRCSSCDWFVLIIGTRSYYCFQQRIYYTRGKRASPLPEGNRLVHI